MAVVVKTIDTKCFECKKPLKANAKMDNKTGKVIKYIEIIGGERREFPNRFKANYCNRCIVKLKQASSRFVQQPELVIIDSKPDEGSFVKPLTPQKGEKIVFCTSKEKKDWGIGKLLGINGEMARVEYFIAPTIANEVFDVNRSSLEISIIFKNRRIYWNDPDTALWRVGRLIMEEEGDNFDVQFPNNDRRNLGVEEIFVRCSKPIDDPTPYLAGYVTESPFLSEARTRFMRSMIAQRGVSQGMSGLLSPSIELEPHQWRVVRQVLNDPIQRYLLADEVGLGKTIEAGIIIRQYVLDYPDSHSVAIIVPPTLENQWYSELSVKFHLSSHIENKLIKIIPSKDIVEQRLDLSDYGMIVIDEAHRIVEGVSAENETDIYRLIRKAVQEVDRLLLLSATPALGNEMTFLAMLHLLDPAIYSLNDYDSFK